MELSLSRGKDITNTRLVSTDGTTTYIVRTPGSKRNRAKSFIDVGAASNSVPLGDIEWNEDRPPRITCTGKTKDCDEYIRGKKTLIRRRWTACDGNEYEWKFRDPLELFTTTSPPTKIAYFKPSSLLKKPKLIITPEGKHIKDSIVIAFVYMQACLQDEHKEDHE